MVGATSLFVALAATGTLGLIEGAVPLVALAGYGIGAYRTERSIPKETLEVYEATAEVLATRPQRFWLRVGVLPVGLALLVGGSRVLLWGAVGIAEAASLSKAVIGLTLVAVGTPCLSWPWVSSPPSGSRRTSPWATSSEAISSTCWAFWEWRRCYSRSPYPPVSSLLISG